LGHKIMTIVYELLSRRDDYHELLEPIQAA
jgi:hypothetical protein